LFFMRIKALFHYTWKLKKPEIPLSNNPSFFFYLGGKKIFLLLRVLWKAKKGALSKPF
jgi:hypothetical protein